jgi:hypothetical protein
VILRKIAYNRNMKNILILVIISLTLNSCALEYEMPNYRFSNFENTQAWDLAKAVKDNDAEKVREILNTRKVNVDFKDPKFQETLLSLAIVNQKQNTIIELLKAGANPNELLGNLKDETPFLNAVRYNNKCDLFYVQTLLKYGANPNLEIQNPIKGHYFANSFPLIVAIGQLDKNGDECLSIVKLLVDNGANINCCYYDEMDDLCEGVINQCISSSNMETLKYFIIEKKIKIPKIVCVWGSIDKATEQRYSLIEILNTEDYQFEDFNDELGNHDLSKSRKIKSEILEYLKKNK